MVEYEYKEALALLTKNLEVCCVIRHVLCSDRLWLAECGEGIGVAGAGHCVPEGPDHHLRSQRGSVRTTVLSFLLATFSNLCVLRAVLLGACVACTTIA
jgi:hypothetical protein